MATTTNFGWTTPDNTALVKDGALAIRTLGSAIDTTLVDLKGGTTGQVLAKASNTDMDFTWSSVDPLTILDAKGDLISATAADTPARLAVGTNGQVLTADSTTSTGLKWATPSSGALTKIAKTTFSGATSASFNDVFSSTYVNYRILLQLDSTSGNNQPIYFRLRVSGSDSATNYKATSSYNSGGSTAYAGDLSGSTYFYLNEIDNDYSNQWYGNIDLFSPQVARNTGFLYAGYNTTASNANAYMFTNGTHLAATSYTGFSLVSATGNIAGTVWIYGYQD